MQIESEIFFTVPPLFCSAPQFGGGTAHTRGHKDVQLYTVSGKKGATLFLPVTLRNANRFSEFFYHHTLQ